jgi:hypothetical protein
LKKGSHLSFGFVALGPTVNHVREVIKSFEQFGAEGLEDHQRRARFRLVEVHDLLAGGCTLYTQDCVGQAVVRNVGRLVAGMLQL